MMGYEERGREVGRLVAEKQAAYGDSFGKSGAVMRVLYPQGIAPEQMDDALCLVRIVDKLFRIATARDALGESPYRDIAGYALLGDARCAALSGKEHNHEYGKEVCELPGTAGRGADNDGGDREVLSAGGKISQGGGLGNGY